MGEIKIFYETEISKQDEIIRAIQDRFGSGPLYSENTIVLRGDEDSGLEIVRLNIRDQRIKILVTITDSELLEFFNSVLGKPTKVKGRLS